MSHPRVTRCCVAVALLVAWPASLLAQEDVAGIPAQDLKASRDGKKRYFLLGPRAGDRVVKGGLGLIVVLPGGPGTADFLSFVKRIYKLAVPPGYLVAQPVAVKWTEGQEVVWPTARVKAKGMRFTTEEFIDAVIDDVASRHKLDRARVFTLSWSSSGPAAYACSLTSRKVAGSLVAMSVFKANFLPDLKKAKGHAYYLYHSRDDRICPFRMAEQAEKDLRKGGARVKLVTYEGGHGWRGDPFGAIRKGIDWLQKNRARAER